jgi:uncharacterized membrane protein
MEFSETIVMQLFDPTSMWWIVVSVQAVGVASACLTRLSEGSLGEDACQLAFLGSLSLMGLATLASLAIGPGACVTSGATLTVMVLTATWDMRRAVL